MGTLSIPQMFHYQHFSVYSVFMGGLFIEQPLNKVRNEPHGAYTRKNVFTILLIPISLERAQHLHFNTLQENCQSSFKALPLYSNEGFKKWQTANWAMGVVCFAQSFLIFFCLESVLIFHQLYQWNILYRIYFI